MSAPIVGLEKKSWMRSVLEMPWAYETFQRSVGKHKLRREFAERYVKPKPGMRVLDFGCGPGDFVPFVPSVELVGFDISEPYLASARSRFHQAKFYGGSLDDVGRAEAPFDVALSIGVLHHIPDDIAVASLKQIASLLEPGGRYLAVEPHLRPGQHWIARELIKRDRGAFVRSEAGYVDLLSEAFTSVDLQLDEDLLRVPYTLTVFTCRA